MERYYGGELELKVKIGQPKTYMLKKKLLSDKIIEGDNRNKNTLGELTEKDLRNLLSYEQEENN